MWARLLPVREELAALLDGLLPEVGKGALANTRRNSHITNRAVELQVLLWISLVEHAHALAANFLLFLMESHSRSEEVLSQTRRATLTKEGLVPQICSRGHGDPRGADVNHHSLPSESDRRELVVKIC